MAFLVETTSQKVAATPQRGHCIDPLRSTKRSQRKRGAEDTESLQQQQQPSLWDQKAHEVKTHLSSDGLVHRSKEVAAEVATGEELAAAGEFGWKLLFKLCQALDEGKEFSIFN